MNRPPIQPTVRPAAGGIEALLARTRKQVTGFTLAAIVSVIAVVGVGSAIAGTRAIDAGLDNALRERAADIVDEIAEQLPPLPQTIPSADPSAAPEPSASLPGSSPTQSPTQSSTPSPSLTPDPSGNPAPSPGGDDDDDDDGDDDDDNREGDAEAESESRDDEEGGDAGSLLAVGRMEGSWREAAGAAYVAGRMRVEEADPVDPSRGGIPAEVLEGEFEEEGPWAILSPNGTLLATSEQIGGEFPLAIVATEAFGEDDLRTVMIGGAEYRLMTLPVRHPDAGPDGELLGYVQVAGRLDISNAQQENLLTTLLIFGGLGLVAALLVSVLVTRRVLAPIAAAASRERGMVAKASHELRTPASVILSSAEILEREGLIKPAGRELLRGIAEESQRLGRLSADLLTLVKEPSATAGEKMSLRPRNLIDVVTTAAERAQVMAQRVKRNVTTKFSGRQLPALADGDRLLQLLLNLVENAIRHSPPGGTVTIGAAEHDGRAELWVDDEGLGIPDEERELIFDPFYRSPRDRSLRDGGSGLGLAIARSIAVAHGGTLDVESSPAGGARLIVRIPLVTQE